ncbi:hypothetical protein YC2023_050936 [Brassica napus]
MRKGRVVIAGSVNNDFEHSEINGPTVGTRWAHGPRERAKFSWLCHYSTLISNQHSLKNLANLSTEIIDSSAWFNEREAKTLVGNLCFFGFLCGPGLQVYYEFHHVI